MAKKKPFGGKQAAPFKKGGGREKPAPTKPTKKKGKDKR